MGDCCCKGSQGSVEGPLIQKPQTTPNLYSGIDQNKLTKAFSDQVEKIKSFDTTYEKILISAEKSASDFKQSLENLNFYYSKKEFERTEQIPEDLECPSCFITYSSDEHKPLNLPCGHNLCESCCKTQYESTKIIKCGSNCIAIHESFESFSVNTGKLEKVKWVQEGLFCFLHSSNTSNYCVNCRKLICEDCAAEHLGHNITPISSPAISKELNIGKANLEAYIRNLEESLEDLTQINKSFEEFQSKLLVSLAENKKKIEEDKLNLLSSLELASSGHITTLKSSLQKIMETMPMRSLSLYYDSLSTEQEKVRLVNEDLQDCKNPVVHMVQADFKNPNKLSDPDFKPWEKVLSQISSVTDIEFLLLALTSLTIKPIN